MDKITVENVIRPASPSGSTRRNTSPCAMSRLTGQPAHDDYTAIKKSIKPVLSQPLFPAGATSGWWIKYMQLDLEAKGEAGRTKDKPSRFFLTSA